MTSSSHRGFRQPAAAANSQCRRSWLALGLLATIALPATLAAQAAGNRAQGVERMKIAKRVVQASGAEALILKSIELTIPAQRSQNPNIPPEFWDRFVSRARADVGLLVDSLAPVYATRFSKAELEQLLAFYESPVGRHVTAEQPAIAQESQQLGVRWGTRMGAAIAVQMADEGRPLRQ